ncbi:MAG: hypothetical protein ACRCVJ_18360 [Clostridium sp.]|uniref:hypothetical protein n=1 Tax=Clostridium sp. TaxID=1506 RepID=UPI003F3BECC9
MSKLKDGVWMAKTCDIMYVLKENLTGDCGALCIESGRIHLIEKDKCRNFLNNHFCLKSKN